jgi:glycosyltransferase involved in cell wall biosynthesis
MGGSAQNTLITALNHDPLLFDVCLLKGSTQESGMTAEEKRLLQDQLGAAARKGITVVDLPPLVRRISPRNDLQAFLEIWRIIRRLKPHIVHTHTSKAGILGRLAAWLARVPIIIHTPHGHVFYGHFSLSLSRLFLTLERLFARITHHHIALTPEEGKDYLTLNISKPENTSIIHSGVDLNRFQNGRRQRSRTRKELGIPRHSLVVGFVGWLLPIKGVRFLVEAMARVVEQHPGSLLVLVGKGEKERELRQQAENLGLADKVRFLGWRQDVEEIMPGLDLLVLPSLNEGMGRVLVEAMAMELPIVASRVGGIPDLVQNEQNGLLVPPADAAALARAISDLLENKGKRKRLGEAGKRMCRSYSAEAMMAQINDLYTRLLEKRFRFLDFPGADLAKNTAQKS